MDLRIHGGLLWFIYVYLWWASHNKHGACCSPSDPFADLGIIHRMPTGECFIPVDFRIIQLKTDHICHEYQWFHDNSDDHIFRSPFLSGPMSGAPWLFFMQVVCQRGEQDDSHSVIQHRLTWAVDNKNWVWSCFTWAIDNKNASEDIRRLHQQCVWNVLKKMFRTPGHWSKNGEGDPCGTWPQDRGGVSLTPMWRGETYHPQRMGLWWASSNFLISRIYNKV